MKLSKVFSIITIAVMLLASVSNIAFAFTVGDITISPSNTDASNKVSAIGGNILQIIQIVGTTVAIVVLIVLGIKYMMGSAEEKAEYKKTLVPYVIGAILVLAAANVVTWIFEAGASLFGVSTE